MMSRCYSMNDKRYPLYGGRGISVTPKWHNFLGFWKDMQDGYENNLTLDRINTDGNYEPKNCRWATWKDQQRNRRDTFIVCYKGRELPLRMLCEEKGVNYMMVYLRLKRYGWDIEKALSKMSRRI